VERKVDALRLEADARRALLQPLGREERGQVLRNARRDARSLPGRIALLALDALPLREEVALDLGALEHVWMAAHELLAEAAGDVAHAERAFLVRELRMDGDLEEEVTELVAEPVEIAGVERLERLVRLLEEVWAQARVRLLFVPRAPVGRAELLGDARHRRDRREIDERTQRRQERVALRERLGHEAVAVVLPQQRGVGLGVEDEHRRSMRSEGVAVEKARGNDVDAAGPAL